MCGSSPGSTQVEGRRGRRRRPTAVKNPPAPTFRLPPPEQARPRHNLNPTLNPALIPREGETQAEYFVEGLLERLAGQRDALSRKLLAGCTFYVVPNMCPGVGGEV